MMPHKPQANRYRGPKQNLTNAPAEAGALLVKGDATWGMGDPERLRRGGVHTGEVAGTARSVDGILAFTIGTGGKALPYDVGAHMSGANAPSLPLSGGSRQQRLWWRKRQILRMLSPQGLMLSAGERIRQSGHIVR